MMNFTDKVVLITGGASGLGNALVHMFASAGAKVVFTYRNSKEKALALENQYEGSVIALFADASDYAQALQVVHRCLEQFGKLDILINNAASANDGPLKKLTPEMFENTLRNVLFPVYNYCSAAAEALCSSNGTIVNIGSINGLRGREGSVAYSTAKAGVDGFTKTIAKELGPQGVNCNVVAPGFIDTDGQARTSELIKKLVLDECAIRHLTTPEEVAHLVLFLASDEAKCITGQVYQIDCGQYI